MFKLICFGFSVLSGIPSVVPQPVFPLWLTSTGFSNSCCGRIPYPLNPIRVVIRVHHVWLGVVVTWIWNHKRSREGFPLLKVSLICSGAKSVVDWSVVGRRYPVWQRRRPISAFKIAVIFCVVHVSEGIRLKSWLVQGWKRCQPHTWPLTPCRRCLFDIGCNWSSLAVARRIRCTFRSAIRCRLGTQRLPWGRIVFWCVFHVESSFFADYLISILCLKWVLFSLVNKQFKQAENDETAASKSTRIEVNVSVGDPVGKN